MRYLWCKYLIKLNFKFYFFFSLQKTDGVCLTCKANHYFYSDACLEQNSCPSGIATFIISTYFITKDIGEMQGLVKLALGHVPHAYLQMGLNAWHALQGYFKYSSFFLQLLCWILFMCYYCKLHRDFWLLLL